MSYSKIRRASHSGSWYSASSKQLNIQLEDWLSKAEVDNTSVRALIAPHAGYSYSGACAAHAYKQVNPEHIKRVFILGPSHHVSLSGCALTQTHTYETPLYNLQVDLDMINELAATNMFDVMNIQADEDEHSLELHLPYIAKVMESRRDHFKIVPVLVGSTNVEKEKNFGKLFSRYLNDPENLFVISSDFCHWGQRFRYTYHDRSKGEPYQSIEHIDKLGMDLIENFDATGFYQYLKRYTNTICGRHPIGIFLNMVQNLPEGEMSFKFHCYAQSNKCRSSNDSSVSYAAGTFSMK